MRAVDLIRNDKILLKFFSEFHDSSRRAVRTENFFNLVRDEFFDVCATRSEILARVKVVGVLHEVFADTGSHGKAQVGVDVDFADCGARCFAELSFRNADCVFKCAAVVVDDFNVFGNDGACAVENNREARDSLFDFGENVKAQFRRFKNAGFGVAGALFGREFECAVAGADSDSQGIATCLCDEFFNLFRFGVVGFVGVDADFVLNARELTKFSLDNYAVCMRVFDDFFGLLNVFCKGLVRAVEHNGGESAVDARFAGCEIRAVIEVQSNRNVADFESRANEMDEILMVGVLASTGGALQNDRRLHFGSGTRDALDDFHVVDVERANGEAVLVSLLKHSFGCN